MRHLYVSFLLGLLAGKAFSLRNVAFKHATSARSLSSHCWDRTAVHEATEEEERVHGQGVPGLALVDLQKLPNFLYLRLLVYLHFHFLLNLCVSIRIPARGAIEVPS